MNTIKFVLLLILTFLLLSNPFLFYSFIGPELQYSILGIILFALLIYCRGKFKIIRNPIALFFFLVYILIEFFINTDYVFYTLLSLFNILFYFVVISLVNNNLILRKKLIASLYTLSVSISILISTSYICYHLYPGLFHFVDDFAGYHGFFNPWLGIVNEDKLRPSWYFAEPSFSGFYLGLNFFLFLQKKYRSKKRKILEYCILLFGIFCTSSTGTFIYLSISLLVYFALKIHVNKKVILIFLYGSVMVSIFVVPKLESYGLLTMAVERNQASFISRQNKMSMVDKTIDSMTLTDYIFGKGASYIVLKNGEGAADSYRKLFIEYGLLFTMVYLWYIRKLTIRNLPLYCFILLSFLSVALIFDPIIILCYYLTVSNSEKDKYKLLRPV